MKPTYNKEFEISLPKAVYFGSYFFDGNKLFIDDVHTYDDDGNRIEIDSLNDAELFARVYKEVEKDKCDEIEAERDYNDWEGKDGKHSKLKDF